jgi:hypothetical protein
LTVIWRLAPGANPDALRVTVAPWVTGLGESDTDGFSAPVGEGCVGDVPGLVGLGVVVLVEEPVYGPSCPCSPGVLLYVIPLVGSYRVKILMIVVDWLIIVMCVALKSVQRGPV